MIPITMASLLREVPRLVGDPPDRRWARASPMLKGSDGEDRIGFFARPAAERIGRLHERMVRRSEWAALLQRDIPKGRGGVRSIAWATALDTAFAYLIADAVSAHAETVLGSVAIGYRPGLALDQSIRRTVQRMRRRSLLHVSALDIANFFPSIPWRHLDAVVDKLPADGDVAALIKRLVRARVRRLDGTPVPRTSGIAQGLPLAPVLANLLLASLDARAQGTLARRGALVVRFADDILLAAADAQSLMWAIRFVTEQLRRLGLAVKAGTGVAVDLRVTEARLRWLGIELAAAPSGTAFVLRAPEDVVLAKAEEIRALLDAGLLSDLGAERRLRGMEQFYRSLLADKTTDRVLQNVRSQVFSNARPLSPPEVDPRREERQVTHKTIEDLLHPRSITMAILKPHRGPKLDGEWNESAGSDRDPSASTVSRGTGKIGGGAHEAREASRSIGTRPSAEDSAEDTEGTIRHGFTLFPPGHAKSAASAEGAGAPADRRSGGPFENRTVRVSAEPRGAGGTFVRVTGAVQAARYVRTPHARSRAEAVLASAARTVQRLGALGLRVEAISTSEPVLAGYITQGWRPRSLGIVSQLQALGEASDGDLRVEVPRDGGDP
jgi:hypothetical protein